MGFLGSLVSATVKTALTPVAVVKDAANITMGDDPNATKNLIDSIGDDIDNIIDL